MQHVSDLEIKEWLTYPVTQAYKQSVLERIGEMHDAFARLEPDQLKFHQGYLAAMKDILEFLSEGSV